MIGNWRTCDLKLFNGLLSSCFSTERFTMIRGREGLSSAALKYMRFMEAEKELPGKINDATVVLRRHDEEESFQDQSSIVSNSSDVEMCSPDDDEDYQRSFQEIMSQHDISLQSNTSFNEENETIAENIKNFHAFETSIEEIFQGISKTPEYEPENEFTCGGFTEVSVTSSQNNNMFKSPPPKRQRLRNFTINPSMLTQDVFNISSKFNSFHDNLESEANFSKFPIHSEALETFNNSQTQFPESSIEKDPTESFIDESMMPERCRTNELEQTIMQNGKLNVSTFYSSQVVRNSNKVIDSYYKVHQFQDWNAIAGEMLEKFEPSLDYLYDKFDLPKSVQLGDENQEIGGEIELEDIRESLKEIEDSFDGLEASFVSSTPTKPNKSCDLLKKSMGINEVTGKQVTNFTEMNHSEKIVAYKSLEIIEKARKNNSNLRATEENDENCNGSQENVKNFNDSKENAENAENLQINLNEEFLEIPEQIQENIEESEKTTNKAKKSSNQNTETSQNFQTTSQNTKKKSLKIKTRISQRLIKKRNLTSQQQIKSVSDIFADITCTQKTATPEIGAFDLSFVHLLDREENRNNGSIVASQEPLIDPDFLEVLHAENPVEALQALTQQNPV